MKQLLEQMLSSQPEFLVDNHLNKNKLSELARKYDPSLLKVLKSNDEVSSFFFSSIISVVGNSTVEL